MENFTELLPLIEGGMSIFNVIILMQISSIKKEIEREKHYFIGFANQEKKQNEDLDNRLNKLEIQAAKRWSTWH